MNDIIIDNATKSYRGRTIFAGLSASIPSGQITAISGASGSGKSTLLNCIGLLEKLDTGSIYVGSRRITRYRGEAQRRFRRDALGYMFQNYALIENASIAENLEVAVAARGAAAVNGADFAGALAEVGLAGRESEPVYSLSGGEQQRVAVARLLVKAPQVVLADEPTGALDAANARMVLQQLRAIASAGAAVLIATHSSEVIDGCDRVLELGASSRCASFS